MKLLIKLMIFLIMLMPVFRINTYAEPIIEQKTIQVTQAEVTADVPEGFDREITINFTLDNGANALYTLNRSNKYKESGVIPIGSHNLNFININGNTGQYDISSAGVIVAYEGQKCKFKVTVTNNQDVYSENKSNESDTKKSSSADKKNIGGNHTQEELESTLITDDSNNSENEKLENDDSSNNDDVEESENTDAEEENKKEKKKSFFRKYYATLLVLSVCGVVFFMIKLKNRYR